MGPVKNAAIAGRAIRARISIREGTRNASVIARKTNEGGGLKLQITESGTLGGLLSYINQGESLPLAKFFLPKQLQPGDTLLLELRIQGDRITGLINGVVVVEAQDARVKGSGEWGINADDGWYESVEVQTLGPASVPAPAVVVGEKWRDWVADNRGEAKLSGMGFVDDGTLVRQPTAVKGGPSWGGVPMRDAAIRATWQLSNQVPGVGQGEPSLTVRRGAERGSDKISWSAIISAGEVRLDLHTYGTVIKKAERRR